MSEPRKASNNPGAADTIRDDTRDWVAIGEVIGTFGISGELKVMPLTDFPERFERTPTVYVAEKRTPFRVLEARPHKQYILLRLQGVADVDAAERLRGAGLWIPADQITALPLDQFYVHDLIGMRVRHVNGDELGTVADVLSSPGNDLFVIQTPDGREVLVPAVKAFIPSIDKSARIITVDPIPGLFDDAAEDAT
ncbi:MAG TPA: ribosome maturation factor RimM [Ktedonobacterales bacterium]|nr:ribosome maturation factor RimM [Ktedonobacterales bacterium]